MPSTVLEYEPPPAALRRTMVLVGWGIFVSTLAQTVTIGSLPLKVMLKDKLGVTPTQMALFFQLANLAWYFKPVAGLLSDSFPLFGTRRRQYLILGCIASAIGWIVLALVPRTYACLLWAAIAVSDVSGSFLYDRWHMPFSALVWINAGTTALVLFAVPFLPRRLMNGREGETMAEFRPVPDSGVPPPINP